MKAFSSFLFLAVFALLVSVAAGFHTQPSVSLTVHHERIPTPLFALSDDDTSGYSRDVRLREEAESPFRKVRFFLFATLGAGALTSGFLSVVRIAAAANGINPELMQESLVNAGVDSAGLVVLGFLYQRDLQAEESRMKRATKGASIAQLPIKVNKGMLSDDPLAEDSSNTEFASLTLADLRRNRGIEKRVVICAAGPEKLASLVEEARACASALEGSDLVVVPVVMPQGTAPVVEGELPRCVALPVGTSAWKSVLADETQEALKQNVDIVKEGICVIVKKNGRVGQRTRGIFLERMVGEVEERREMGMDVTNI